MTDRLIAFVIYLGFAALVVGGGIWAMYVLAGADGGFCVIPQCPGVD